MIANHLRINGERCPIERPRRDGDAPMFADGSEQCDDNNASSLDGCDSGVLETGWTCSGQPSICLEICGDFLLVGAENCEDGNTSSLDGCSSICQQENGWTCLQTDIPITGMFDCSNICGDPFRVSVEGCDDGNSSDNIGCEADCSQPLPCFNCAGGDFANPDVCIDLCNDPNPMGYLTREGWECISATPTNQCAEICGDGILVGSETCDDGDDDGIGCETGCRGVAEGYSCDLDEEPSDCTNICGDGLIAVPEVCDDGN